MGKLGADGMALPGTLNGCDGAHGTEKETGDREYWSTQGTAEQPLEATPWLLHM